MNLQLKLLSPSPVCLILVLSQLTASPSKPFWRTGRPAVKHYLILSLPFAPLLHTQSILVLFLHKETPCVNPGVTCGFHSLRTFPHSANFGVDCLLNSRLLFIIPKEPICFVFYFFSVLFDIQM